MRKQNGVWTQEKLITLKEEYPTHSYEQLSEMLEISVGAIYNKIKRLNDMNLKRRGGPIFPPKKTNSKEVDETFLDWCSSQAN